MKVAVSLLLENAEALAGGSYRWGQADPVDGEKRVSGIALLEEGREPWDEDLLYVADTERAAEAADRSFSVCLAPEGCTSASALSFLGTAFDRCRAWFEDCMRSICTGAEMEEVFASVVSGVENPVAFIDEKGSLAYGAGECLSDDCGAVWKGILKGDHAFLELFDEADQALLLQKLDAGEEIISLVSHDKPARQLVFIPMYDDGTFSGSPGSFTGGIASVDVNAPFRPSQLEQLRLASRLTFMLALSRNSKSGLERGAPYYADCLLRGVTVPASTVARRFEEIGWKSDGSYIVYRFEAFGPDGAGVVNNVRQTQLKQFFVNAIWVSHRGGLVAVCKKDDFDGTDPVERERLDTFLKATQIRCGVSTCEIGFMGLRYQHTQCELALQTLSSDNQLRVASFDESYPGILRDVLGRTLDERCLCHPAVMHLARSERPQDAVLLETLKSFLLNGRSIAAASRALDVHRNTLLYRIEKLKDSIGVNLDEMDEPLLMHLLISCLLVG